LRWSFRHLVGQQQQPSTLEQQVKAKLGELLFSNAVLLPQTKVISDENAKLKSQIEELGKKIEKPQDGQ